MDQKYLALEISRWNLKKRLSYLKSAHSNFSNCKFRDRTKMSRFGTKNVSIGYFWAGMWKKDCHFWNQHHRICLIAKYREIMKMAKIGTKSALFGCFWARILKSYCHIWNQHLAISVIAKFYEEKEMPRFGTKNALFGYFWPKMSYLGIFEQEFQKSYCHIWNQHHQICLFAKF